MSFIKKIIIFVIFAILVYILFRLIKKRTEILHVMKNDIPITEGLSCISEIKDPSVKKLMDSNTVGQIIDNLSSKGYYNTDDTIDKYHIKASYNSAYNGKEISKDMLLYILSRGYRYLDFEVYYDIVSSASGQLKTAVVSYVDGSTVANVTMTLTDILDIINLNAFSNVENKNDPLFIQIRPIYSMPSANDSEDVKNKKIGENTQLNTQIQNAFSSISTSYKYNGEVTSSTKISSLLSKIVIIMDKTSNVYSNNKTVNLINMINIDPVNMTLCNAESKLEDCNKNNNKLIQVTPTDSNEKKLTQNPESLDVISKTSCNICPMMAWMSSYTGGFKYAGLSQLGEYETMFLNAGGSAFILLSQTKDYCTANNPTKLNSNTLSY